MMVQCRGRVYIKILLSKLKKKIDVNVNLLP